MTSKRKRASIDATLQNKRNSPLTFTPDNDAAMSELDSDLPQKVRIIDDLQKQSMQPGQTWYLVDRSWTRRWRSACSGEITKEDPISESDLGPVATASLLDEFGNLKPGLAEGIDVEYMPHDAWNHLTSWYGTPPTPVPRQTITRGLQQQVQLELYPPHLRVSRLNDTTEPPKTVSLSTNDSLKTLSNRLATAVSPSPSPPPYRIWKVSGDDFSLEHLDKDEKNIVESSDQTLEDAGIQSHDSFAVEFKSADDKWLVDLTPVPIFKSKDGFFNRMTSSASPFFNKSAATTAVAKTVRPGTLGLGNMGNTCFMNSAVQCLAHTREIAEYFLSGVYEQELNPDNPLGMHGQIAQAFAALLNKIWSSTPQSNSSYSSSNSYSPREFKATLSKFAPQFSGYQQHDSQEFVAFLLDGLHEDLNRILKKPYVENPDWDEERQKRAQIDYAKEILDFARESWKGYKKRNDSVIVDLFQGQYQSTLICPECEKVSITFDPFMYLTLPLPVQKKWKHDIYYVPWDNDKPHLRIPVQLPRADCSFREVRLLLGRWLGVDPDNLLSLETFGHRFYKNLDDNVLCSDMSDSDVVVCFELPCHARQSRSYHQKKLKEKERKEKKKKKVKEEAAGKDDELDVKEEEKEEEESDEPFIVPFYLCDAPPANSTSYGGYNRGTYGTYNRGPSLFGYPGIAVVPREKATSVEGIYECVVDRMQRWTKNKRDLWTWEEGKANGSARIEEVDGDDMEEIQIDFKGAEPAKEEMITEIKKQDGEVVAEEVPVPASRLQTQTPPRSPSSERTPEEGDIVDEKSMVMVEDDNGVIAVDDDEDDAVLGSAIPVKVGPKKDVFTLRLQKDHENFGTSGYYGSTAKFVSWDLRTEKLGGEGNVLLQENDAFYCEFDENMKMYYFGEERGGGAYGGGSFSSGSGGKYDQALWDAEHFTEFLHPDFKATVEAEGEKKHRGITLHDCLSEFTKEEKLGEDDLWYCPRCKKHQQATKRFDLWKVPDVLVVHLKRFSNSRILRDKIDVFVDFPTDSLDLGDMVGERKVLRELVGSGRLKEVLGDAAEEGEEEELIKRSEEPLIYDLFGVDEHIGGLGGGHYRAYAYNHMDDTWYHFDDSYVTPSKAAESVNQNAYLLFYRRRSSTPLGGKSHDLVEEAKLKPKTPQDDTATSSTTLDADEDLIMTVPGHNPLPTPPNEDNYDDDPILNIDVSLTNPDWTTSGSRMDEDGDPPPFEDSMSNTLLSDPVDPAAIRMIDQKKLSPFSYAHTGAGIWGTDTDSPIQRPGSSTSSLGAEPGDLSDLELEDDNDNDNDWSQRTAPSVTSGVASPSVSSSDIASESGADNKD